LRVLATIRRRVPTEDTRGPRDLRTKPKGVHPEGLGLETARYDGLLYPQGEAKTSTGLSTLGRC
jgi:hypothetical protein